MAVFVALLGACGLADVTTSAAEAGFVLTPGQEYAYGLEYFPDCGAPETEDAELRNRVQEIGSALSGHSDRPHSPYRFVVYRSDELQAKVLFGGRICLPEGIVRFYDDRDELAFVVSHELAHAALRHLVLSSRLSEILGAERAQALRSRLSPSDARRLIAEPWGRNAELEADLYGALYAMRADFRFSAASESLIRLAEASPGPGEDAMHPSYATRIAELGKLRDNLEAAMGAFDRGTKALRRGDPQTAIDALTLFLSDFPNDTAGRINLGHAHLALVRLESGTPSNLAEALPILPEPTTTLRGIVDLGDVRAARRHFSRALELNHRDPDALAGLALAKMRQPSPTLGEARELLQQARDLDGTSPELRLCLGNIDYLEGDYRSARASYEQALSMREGWPPAIKNLALTAEKVEDKARARELWSWLTRDENLGEEARDRLRLLDVAAADPDAK